MTPDLSNDFNRRGLLAAIGASLMMAAMGSCIKIASADLETEMIVFLRNAFGLLVLLPAFYRGGADLLRTRRLRAHLARSIAGLAAMYCFFYAIARLQLAEAVLLNFSSPVFTALLAALWLKESLSRQTAVAVTLGLVGIALILKPSPSHFSIAALVGLASAILAAVAMINIRDMSTTEPTLRIVLYFAITASLMSAVPLIWAWEPLTSRGLIAMAAAGTCASIGQVLLTHAYSSAPAAKVGTVNYSTIVFAGMFGWVFWQERPDLTAFLGASLVCLAGILVARRKSAKAA